MQATDANEFTAEEREVLAVCRRLMAEIAATPDPPAWKRWEAADLADLRRYGPRYSPSRWFGDGRPVPERYRVRYLRAVQSLESAGLVKATNAGNRLAFLRLTTEGEKIAATLEPTP